MAYGRKRKRSSSYPGSSKRSRKIRRSTRRTYRRTRRRRSRYNAAMSTKFITRPSRALNLRGLGLPSKMVVHLPYRETVNLTSGVGVINSYLFRLNSMYDPNATGIGQQPRFYDQIFQSGLYVRYRVYKADVVCTFRNRGSSDCQVGVQIRGDPTHVPPGPAQLYYDAELPYSASRMLNGVGDGGDKNRTTFKFSVNIAKFFGVPKTTFYGDSTYAAVYSNNPTSSVFLILCVGDDPNEASTANVDIEVSIVYHALAYYQTYEIAQS